jgi:hypothetical protein
MSSTAKFLIIDSKISGLDTFKGALLPDVKSCVCTVPVRSISENVSKKLSDLKLSKKAKAKAKKNTVEKTDDKVKPSKIQRLAKNASSVTTIETMNATFGTVTSEQDVYVGLVFHNSGRLVVPFFPDAYATNLSSEDRDLKTGAFSITLFKWLKALRAQCKSLTVDILSCNFGALKVNQMAKALDCTIRFSVNQTGSGKNSDWLLEKSSATPSVSTSIREFYFVGGSIDLWSYSLYSTGDVTGLAKSGGIKGIKYSHGSNTYHVTQDFVWFSSDEDFYITLTDNDKVDGHGHTIQVPDYSYGLFNVEAETHHARIKDLTVICAVDWAGGAIVRQNSTLFKVDNCHLVGYMDESYAGGICGADCYNFEIRGCTSQCEIDDNDMGGICGNYCDNFIISDCSHTGDIYDNRCGGIVASECTNFEVLRCEVNCNIYDSQCGGIVGYKCGYNDLDDGTYANAIIIKDCKYTGYMDGYSGGICAGYLGWFELNDDTNLTTNIVIERCSAMFTDDSYFIGGICASHLGFSTWNDEYTGSHTLTLKIKDCRVHGNLRWSRGGGIVGSYALCSETFDGYTVSATGEIENCVVVGNIYDTDCGGIVGFDLNNEEQTNASIFLTIKRCAFMGFNNGDYAGGILGAGGYNCAIENCYSTGYIFYNAYGIASYAEGNVTITGCYSAGHFDDGAYGISDGVDNTITNCYSREHAVTGVNPLGNLFGHLSALSHHSWKKKTHSYPILKVLTHSPWSHYDSYKDHPLLNRH